MEVKPGYKQTEVGVIPEEWEVKPLADVAEFLDGKRRPVKDSDRARMKGEIPYYGASGVVDYVNDFLFDEELILLGEDGENILSRNCRLAFKIYGKSWVNNHAHVLRPKPGVSLDYLVEFLESRDYAQYNTGTAQPKLNKLVCSAIPVLCPRLPEQRAIAEALSDVDGLLGGLDQLIAKKRDLKQATMQQLLTGQTHLSGFHGQWEEKRIKAIVQTPVTDGPHLTPRFLNDGIPFLSVNNLVDNKIDLRELRYISMADHETFSRKCKPRKGDILLGKAASVGKVALVDFDIEFNIWSPIAMIRLNSENDPSFVYYQLQSADVVRQITLLTNSSSQGNIGMGDIEKLTIRLPSLPEQIAIAAVLSDMDVEIAALEQRREKTRDLKQAMMRELLTGKTRLVAAGGTHARTTSL